MSKKVLSYFALLGVAFLYGANFSIAKVFLDAEVLGSFGLVFCRILTGFIFFSVIHFLWIREKIEKSDFLMVFLCGFFGIAANQLFFIKGLSLTKPISASLIVTLTPILVMVFSVLKGVEKLSITKWVGVAIAAIGTIFLILNGNASNVGESHLMGDFLVLMNSTSYAIYIVLAAGLMKKYHPFTLMKWIFSIGFLLVIPFGLPDMMQCDFSLFTNKIWMSFAFVLFGATVLTYLFNAFALKHVNPSVVGAFIYVQPIFSFSVSSMIGNDEITLLKVVFGLLIFIGVYLVTKKS